MLRKDCLRLGLDHLTTALLTISDNPSLDRNVLNHLGTPTDSH